MFPALRSAVRVDGFEIGVAGVVYEEMARPARLAFRCRVDVPAVAYCSE